MLGAASSALRRKCGTKVSQHRARQRFTGACRPISPDFVGALVAAALCRHLSASTEGARHQANAANVLPRKQTRCATRVLSRPRNLFCFPRAAGRGIEQAEVLLCSGGSLDPSEETPGFSNIGLDKTEGETPWLA